MLVLRQLEVEGFGPFADKQVIDFPDEGVVAVYGENMRGKTSLLNAIRYAFFGTVLGRGSRERRLHTLSNRDRAAEGCFGFSVVLKFTHGDQHYELLRECKPRHGIQRPEQDSDYDEDVYLLRGDQPLGPNERERALAQVFPDQVSRFFLFDGELLQEYEELLHDQSEAGRRISQAIERILGLPILKNGRAHLSQLREEANKAAGFEASRSQETEATGNALQTAVSMKAEQQKELERLREELAELHDDRTEAEEFLSTNARYDAILRERDASDHRLQEVCTELDEAEASLRAAMKDAWRTMLSPQVRQAREAAQESAARQLDTIVATLRREALETGSCGTCGRDLDTTTESNLRARIAAEPEEATENARVQFGLLAALNNFEGRDVTELVRQLAHSVRQRTVERVRLREKVKDLNTELGDADVERMRSNAASLSDIAKKIAIVETAIGETEDKLEDLDNNIERLTAKLDGLGTANLRTTRLRSALLRDAAEVFSQAVEHYKAELRQRVQTSATELFLSMTTEKEDYAGLSINDSYGLEIQHREGGSEDGRSAGAEHVVALALMGALQRNAPLRGPIVMDSPFGRLDPGHTENVVATLPAMAPQVALLVHGKEVTRGQLRHLLGGSLKHEYELVRESARRTKIVRVD